MSTTCSLRKVFSCLLTRWIACLFCVAPLSSTVYSSHSITAALRGSRESLHLSKQGKQMSFMLTSFAGIFIVDHIWWAAGLHIVAGINRVQIERCEHGEAGEQERTPRCEVHDWASGAGIEVQTERDDRRRVGGRAGGKMGGFRGNEIPLEGGFKHGSASTHKHKHTHTLCSHSGVVICAAGLCASA